MNRLSFPAGTGSAGFPETRDLHGEATTQNRIAYSHDDAHAAAPDFVDDFEARAATRRSRESAREFRDRIFGSARTGRRIVRSHFLPIVCIEPTGTLRSGPRSRNVGRAAGRSADQSVIFGGRSGLVFGPPIAVTTCPMNIYPLKTPGKTAGLRSKAQNPKNFSGPVLHIPVRAV
jgi:hypothetical protein